jgi:hypothetical protein
MNTAPTARPIPPTFTGSAWSLYLTSLGWVLVLHPPGLSPYEVAQIALFLWDLAERLYQLVQLLGG